MKTRSINLFTSLGSIPAGQTTRVRYYSGGTGREGGRHHRIVPGPPRRPYPTRLGYRIVNHALKTPVYIIFVNTYTCVRVDRGK